MTDAGAGAGVPRSDAGDGDRERKAAARRPRARRPKNPPAQPASSPSWQGPASWFDDQDVANGAANLDADLVSLGFISAALRRGRRVWVGFAVLGLLLGMGVWAARPPTPQASTTLLLDVGPESQPGTAILNDQVMAQSRGVAGKALRALGLRQSIQSLQATYTATVVTNRVLLISASAPTSSQAVTRADALAGAFLAFRADQLRMQQDLQFAALDNVLKQSEQELAAINADIHRAAKKPASDSERAKLKNLLARRDRAESAMVALKDQVNTARATAEETTAAMVGQSGVLDRASPLRQSRLKPLVLFSGAGLIVGLFVGLGMVIIHALISDRLRRRDDVAVALGAPVRLSIPAESPFRWRPGQRGLAAARGRDVRRIVAFLCATLPTGSRRRALAVVPVDDTRVAALSVVSLAATLAQENARVVVADLCSTIPAAKLVGLKDPGVHVVTVDGAQIEVAIPDPQAIDPVGPFSPTAAPTRPAPADELAAACASADVLLTLTTLDPSLPSDHLRTWAADAVVLVTAGRSSWTKIHAVGALIRLGGTRLVSAVLLGADKWDESLGVTAPRGAGPDLSAADRGSTEVAPFDDARKSKLR